MKRHSKTSLFLMELILSILLFSLCSAICVQLFVRAHRKEQNAIFLNWAVLACDSAAAHIQQEKALPAPVCYDESFRPCAPEDAAWKLEAKDITPSGSAVGRAYITVRDMRGADPAAEPLAYALTIAY